MSSGLYIPGYGYTNDPENQAAVQAEAARRAAEAAAAAEAAREAQRQQLLGRDWAAEGAGSRPAEGPTRSQREAAAAEAAAAAAAAAAAEEDQGVTEVIPDTDVVPEETGRTGSQMDELTRMLMEENRRLREQVDESRRVDPMAAARQERAQNQAAMRAAISWLPSALIDTYVDEWVKTGDAELSWAVVRQSGTYDQYFPQNRRADGTLRMTEQEYLSHKDAFRRELRQYGLNPEVFEDRHQDLVAGEVSAQEFRQRIDAKVTGVIQNLPEVRRRFGEFYGIGQMSDEALIAASLDADIGQQLLQGRITAAQISGEALRAGFERGLEASERLAQAGGLDQMQAREFFSDAGTAVPMFGRFAQRFGGGPFGIEQYEEAAVFGESSLQRRMRRLHASEMALFRQGPVTEIGQMGEMAGLRRR